MTLLVDRRKDNYDELLVLARDSRIARARTQRWTTALVIGAMVAMGLYVSAMNEQAGKLGDAANEAVRDREEAERAYDRLLGERDALKSDLLALRRYQDLYAQITPPEALSRSISRFAERTTTIGDPGTTVQETQSTTFALRNLVWMVDGSRRFPVIDGDILWLPDAGFWIEYTTRTAGNETLHRFFRHSLDAGTVPTPGTGVAIELPYRTAVRVGATDCVEIRHHPQSLRPLFRNAGYGDIEVTFFPSDETNPCQ